MGNANCTTLNKARKLTNVENEKCTLQDREYVEKTENNGKVEAKTVETGYGEKQ